MCHLHRDGNEISVDVRIPFNGIDRLAVLFAHSFNAAPDFHVAL